MSSSDVKTTFERAPSDFVPLDLDTAIYNATLKNLTFVVSGFTLETVMEKIYEFFCQTEEITSVKWNENAIPYWRGDNRPVDCWIVDYGSIPFIHQFPSDSAEHKSAVCFQQCARQVAFARREELARKQLIDYGNIAKEAAFKARNEKFEYSDQISSVYALTLKRYMADPVGVEDVEQLSEKFRTCPKCFDLNCYDCLDFCSECKVFHHKNKRGWHRMKVLVYRYPNTEDYIVYPKIMSGRGNCDHGSYCDLLGKFRQYISSGHVFWHREPIVKLLDGHRVDGLTHPRRYILNELIVQNICSYLSAGNSFY